MNEDIIVRYISLPVSVRAFTVPDSQGNFNVYINSSLTFEQQRKSFEHEMCHIENGDFFRDEAATDIEGRMKK